jgi:hypothetical protein
MLDCRLFFIPLRRKIAPLILLGWLKAKGKKRLRYSDVAECQCNMDTVENEKTEFCRRMQERGVPLLLSLWNC